MQRLENTIIGIGIGAVPIIACFIAGWWLSLPFVPETKIFLYALAGFLFGTLIDIIFLRNWIKHAFTMKLWIWMGIYGFYSIGLFGLFMGFPIFNLFLALPAGIFIGRRLTHQGVDPNRMRKVAQQTAIFTTIIMGLVCITSASIALLDQSVAADLQGMLKLPFPVTTSMIIGIIVIGGTLILAFEWWLTIKSVRCGYKLSRLTDLQK